jgi:hypothetical protein
VIRSRRYSLNGRPVETAVSYIPADLASGTPIAEPNPGPGGIYARLEDSGHVLERFTEEVAARMPTPDEARALALPPGVPVFRLVRTAFELARGPLVTGPPKSAAGRRDVVIPAFLLPGVTAHLDAFTADGPRALVFIGPRAPSYGEATSAGNGTRPLLRPACLASTSTIWTTPATTWPVRPGATLRELMDRMGHVSTLAALSYQHRTTHRDQIIAEEISRRVQAELKPSGTQRARKKGERSRRRGR